MANFNEAGLRKKLSDLNMSQESIQTMSLWLIHHKKHAHVVVNVWYRELTKAPENQKLAFMYLANDVIQNGKKKGPEYSKEFGHRLPKAFKHLSSVKFDEKSISRLRRILQVWEERGVFDSVLIKEFKRKLGIGDKENKPSKMLSELQTYDPKKERRKSKDSVNKDEFPVAYQDPGDADVEMAPVVEENSSYSPTEIIKGPENSKSSIPPPQQSTTSNNSNAADRKPPPQSEDLIQALQDLENAATGDAEVRNKIASLPTYISDISGVNKLKDAVAGQELAQEVENALDMLETYNKRLSQEMEARKSVARILHDYISHQKDLLVHTEETLDVHRQKLSNVQKVSQELKAHLQNLPDISKLPNLGGRLAPLPSAGDLFT